MLISSAQVLISGRMHQAKLLNFAEACLACPGFAK